MGNMPEEPGLFAERVAEILQDIRPELRFDDVAPGELIVNGRRLDLSNLMRLVRTDLERGEEIVEQYLCHLFDEDTMGVSSMDWELAKPRIMPRIQPESIFDHLCRDMVAHVPFVNNTVIVFVIDMPNMTISVTTEQLVRWGVEIDELDDIARANLNAQTPDLQIRWMESADGGKAAIITRQDGYDASRLLLGGLYKELGPTLGGDFLVGAPSRDMFVAVGQRPDSFVERVRMRIHRDFERLPYPITDRFFYVTRDGVAGTLDQAA